MGKFFFQNGVYSLKKSKHLLRHVYKQWKRRKNRLTPEASREIVEALKDLEVCVLAKQRDGAYLAAQNVERLVQEHLKRSTFDHGRDLVFALGFALLVAVLVRQMWFEFYEIPSGSMRPTFKEHDMLVVSKTDFGINVPLTTRHFYFDNDLVKRGGIVIFTGENMNIRDVDTLYFYLFPGKKQYVKRMIGKPGDILYFYGGKIYGIDKEGNDITSTLQPEQLGQIDHIPFIDFDRKLATSSTPVNGIYTSAVIYQMDEPVARLFATSQSQAYGEMLPMTQTHDPSAPPIKEYSDLWGFKNYAMARLLSRQQVRQLTDFDPAELDEGLLYLELRHHPSLATVRLGRDEMGRLRPMLGISISVIPLRQEHLEALFDHLYTARFTVKNNFAYRYGLDASQAAKNLFLPSLPKAPEGTFEFYHGKGYEIGWKGVAKKLPEDHPLSRFDADRLQLLFNLGIEFDLRFAPQIKNQRLVPSRYAYFRDGDLYVMGAPIIKKDDPTLVDFLAREQKKQDASSNQRPYHPFQDFGPPILADGTIDKNLIRQFGLMVPEKGYLVLGDNYAMSADSRDFGFVPEDNLRGAPDWIFWPPGSRWGAPNQPPYPWFPIPRLIVWVLALLCISGSTWYWRKHNKLPLNFS